MNRFFSLVYNSFVFYIVLSVVQLFSVCWCQNTWWLCSTSFAISLCGLIEFMAIYLVCCLLDRWFFFFFYHRWFCFVILLLWKLEVYWWEMNLLNLAASWRKTKKQHLKKKNIFKIWAITGKLSTILIQPRKDQLLICKLTNVLLVEEDFDKLSPLVASR